MKKISAPLSFAIIGVLAIIAITAVLMFSQKLEVKPLTISTPTQTPVAQNSPAESPNIETAGWQGTFSIAGYGQSAVLEQVNSSNVKLIVIGPDVRPNEPTCSFTGTGTINSDTLTINLDNSQYPSQPDAKIIAKLSVDRKQLTIEANSFDNRFALMRFCYGGGTIGGTYIRE